MVVMLCYINLRRAEKIIILKYILSRDIRIKKTLRTKQATKIVMKNISEMLKFTFTVNHLTN